MTASTVPPRTTDPEPGRGVQPMPSVALVVAASLEAVWDVLSDGWLYPLWVVGAARIRAVDREWPEPGARLHHSFGTWPLLVDDETEVLGVAAGRALRLRARGWPLGEAEVEIRLEERLPGTRVTIAETAVSGPGRLVPQVLETPLVRWRNTETLRRLALLVEGRANG